MMSRNYSTRSKKSLNVHENESSIPVRTSSLGNDFQVSATEQQQTGYLLLCCICHQDLVPSEPTSIQCDSCKNLFHPSCLGSEGPLDCEKWFCAVCSLPSDKNVPRLEESHECPKTTHSIVDEGGDSIPSDCVWLCGKCKKTPLPL